MGDPKVGLFGKFIVSRVDGQDRYSRKHDGCRYFVLDANHDPHAAAALLAYAESCKDEYPILAMDLVVLAGLCESRESAPG